jgi:hypothetical protein
MNTIKPNPRVTVPGIAGYLLWLKQDLPAVYANVMQKFPEVAAFDARLKSVLAAKGLGFDWSSIGSDLSSAASSVGSVLANVGSYVAQNTPAILTTGAGLYGLVAKQQMLNTQLQLAQSNQLPVQTGIVQSAGNAPYLTAIAPTGGVMQSSAYGGIMQSTIAGVPTWVFLVAAVAGGALLLRGRR